MPARAPASMLMLQSVIRPSIESARTASPAYSIVYPVAPSVPILPMIPSARSFAVTPSGSEPRVSYFHRERLVLRQALRGQHVLDFARADAKCERSKSAVSARVTIATNDRHARLRQTKLRPNDVNDSLFGGVDVEELNAKLFAVSTECLDLIRGNGIGNWQTAIRGGDVVIDSAESEIRASHFAICLTQSIKRLRRRHLVNEM